MSAPYSKHLLPTVVPQSQALPGQVPNSAGGYAFELEPWARLDRFLILGTEGGTYYASESKLSKDNIGALQLCLKLDGPRTVDRIIEVSDSGRAPKNEPALLALAVALKQGDEATRRAAGAALPKVARTGTHLFHLIDYVNTLGGWGRLTRRAFAEWYTGQEPAKLALQLIKYQSRDGWSHRDVLRMSHPKATGTTQDLLHYAVKGWEGVGDLPHPDRDLARVWAFEKAKTARGQELIRLITEYRLPHECVPNEAKSDPAVWEAMLPSMGLTALIRNLGKLTSVGVIAPLAAALPLITGKLQDAEELRRGRIHPIQVLQAQTIYGQGHGDKGSLTWTPNPQVVDALDAAFHTAFKTIVPAGKRTLLGIDCSGSMMGGSVGGMPALTPRTVVGCMALATARTEPWYHFVGFNTVLFDLAITAKSSLAQAIKVMDGAPWGGTDCAAPMIWALKNKVQVDTFCVYTDNETWAGNIHPSKALEQYRQKTGIPARLAVFGVTATEFTIADPKDAGMMDFVGFDSAAPGILADFSRGDL